MTQESSDVFQASTINIVFLKHNLPTLHTQVLAPHHLQHPSLPPTPYKQFIIILFAF